MKKLLLLCIACSLLLGGVTVKRGPGRNNADTATALAADPTDCAANQFAESIAANGDLTCLAIVDADVPTTITIDSATIGQTIPTVDTEDATTYVALVDAAAATQAVWTDEQLTYDANTGVLGAAGLDIAASATPGLFMEDNTNDDSDTDFGITIIDNAANDTQAVVQVEVAGTLTTYFVVDGIDERVEFAKETRLMLPAGADPASCLQIGELFLDTDETDDTNCTTTADNSLCVCTAAGTPGTWASTE